MRGRRALAAKSLGAVSGKWDRHCMGSEAEGADGSGAVERLGPEMRGCWRVTTRKSVHMWDLDQWTYRRLPGELSKSFVGDGQEAPIYSVERWPQVGQSFLVYVDDLSDWTMAQMRLSSPVQSIERALNEG